MFERLQFRSVSEQQAYLLDEGVFLSDYLQSYSQSGETATVEYLQQVARVRMDLDMATNLLVDNLAAAGM